MSIQFNIMDLVFRNFKIKYLFYNSLRTYDIFIKNMNQLFISYNKILFFGYLKILTNIVHKGLPRLMCLVPPSPAPRRSSRVLVVL